MLIEKCLFLGGSVVNAFLDFVKHGRIKDCRGGQVQRFPIFSPDQLAG